MKSGRAPSRPRVEPLALTQSRDSAAVLKEIGAEPVIADALDAAAVNGHRGAIGREMAATEPNWRRRDSFRLPSQLIGPGCVRSPGDRRVPPQADRGGYAPPPRSPRRPFDGQSPIVGCLEYIVVHDR